MSYYNIPDSWAHLNEITSQGPVENPREAALYRHHTLEESVHSQQVYEAGRRQSAAAERESLGAGHPAPTGFFARLAEGCRVRLRRCMGGCGEC